MARYRASRRRMPRGRASRRSFEARSSAVISAWKSASGADGQIAIVGLSSRKTRAASAARPMPAMIAEGVRQVEEMQLGCRYPDKKGQQGFPLSTPKRGTVVPKKGNPSSPIPI